MKYDLNAPTEMENITLEESSTSPCPKDTGGLGGGSLRTGFDASGKISMFTVAVPLVTVKCAIMLHTRAFVSLLLPGSAADGCGPPSLAFSADPNTHLWLRHGCH